MPMEQWLRACGQTHAFTHFTNDCAAGGLPMPTDSAHKQLFARAVVLGPSTCALAFRPKSALHKFL